MRPPQKSRDTGTGRNPHPVLSVAIAVAATVTSLFPEPLKGQEIRFGGEVPPAVEIIYENGLAWLASTQKADGSWNTPHTGPGVTGICLMAFLASGEDPNFGRHAPHIRRAIRNIISGQDRESGYFGGSMYHHGFATLTLAEAYGAVDDSLLWQTGGMPITNEEDAAGKQSINPAAGHSIARSLELAIRCAVDAQQRNPAGGWRYSPGAADADTSVVGTVLMGLLACRNAGLPVPNQSINRALEFMRQNTGPTGFVSYHGGFGGSGESTNRSAVATLVHAVGRQKDKPKYRATLKHISTRLEHNETGHPYYFIYYMAQALFQGDYPAWEKWNAATIRKLKNRQKDNGSFGNSAYQTAMSLLALALNHRLLPIYER